MINQTKPKKPMALLYDEARKAIYNGINIASKLIPFYMIEEILTNYLSQVMKQSEREIDNAAKLYEKQMAEYAATLNDVTETEDKKNDGS